MEDVSHPAGRKLNLERTGAWSRLEEHRMMSVYEHLVPIVGARIQPVCDEHRATPCRERPAEMPSRAVGA